MGTKEIAATGAAEGGAAMGGDRVGTQEMAATGAAEGGAAMGGDGVGTKETAAAGAAEGGAGEGTGEGALVGAPEVPWSDISRTVISLTSNFFVNFNRSCNKKWVKV